MNSPRTFLAACGLVLLSSVSCAPAPAATTQSAATTGAPSCADESAAEELVNKGLQIEHINADQALALYEQARALALKNARIQYRIGTIYRKKEAWEKAVESFSRAIALDPSFANYWLWYGYSLDIEHLTALPKSPIGKAIAYALNHWIPLTRFLEDGRLRLDNNRSELELRSEAIGRKN